MHGPSYVFLIGTLSLLTGISYLIYRILKTRTAAFERPWTVGVYWGITVLMIGGLYTSRWLYAAGVPASWFALPVLWIVTLLLLVPLLLILLGVEYGQARLTGRDSAGGMSRRGFLRRAFAATPLLALGGSARGVYNAEQQLVVQRYTLQWPELPPALEDFKIVQLSDTHVGTFFGLDKLDRALAVVRQEHPHLLVITGDLIDDLELLDETVARLTALSGQIPYGIYFCWGNHEYFRNFDQIEAVLKQSPVKILRNSSALVLDGEKPFYLAGVDYPWAKDGQEQETVRQDLFQQAMRTVPAKAFTVLLSHHPDFIDNAFAAGIPLTLSGHTHGGQIGLFGHSLLPLSYRYMRGFYRQGDRQGYVSTGTGHWLPFRLGCPAEVGVFTFRLP